MFMYIDTNCFGNEGADLNVPNIFTYLHVPFSGPLLATNNGSFK